MRQFFFFILLVVFSAVALSCSEPATQKSSMKEEDKKHLETATFGEGCFWCSEAIFERVAGVKKVFAGYSGGDEPDPDYKLVSSGHTRYAEVVQIYFDPDEVSYKELLEIFFKTHDPTMVNRQGADIGPQYRSVIFYHNQKQKREAEYYKEQLEKAGIWTKPIATEIAPYKNFYKAEKYHQNYYKNNPSAGYCQFVITPKLKKFEAVFKDKLK